MVNPDFKMSEQVHDHEVRVSLLEQAVQALNKDLEKINNNLSKLVWIAAGSLIAAVANWIMKGSLII